MADGDDSGDSTQKEVSTSVQNNRLLWWLMGLVGVLCVGAVGAWMTSVQSIAVSSRQDFKENFEAINKTVKEQSSQLTMAVTELAKELREGQMQHRERIVRLEAGADNQRQQIGQFSSQLTRVETLVEQMRAEMIKK